jgi:thiol-disulfide isomerase/thioredoxin
MRSHTILLSSVSVALALSSAVGPVYALSLQDFPQAAAASSSSIAATSTMKGMSQHRALQRTMRQQWADRAAGKYSRPSSSSSSLPTGTYTYLPFGENVIGNGPAFLYFYADWHVPSRANDKKFVQWSKDKKFIIPFYKVDYDEETLLRKRYNVIHANTFVLIDAKGNKVRLVETPYEATLKNILYGE